MDKKKRNIHGIISVILFFISLLIGIAAIALYSIIMSLIGFLIIVLTVSLVSFFYCSKCKCRDNCNHWIFGKISKIFSEYNHEKYTKANLIAGTIIPLIVMIAFPQYWLINEPVMLILYWGLFAIAGLDVHFFVCTKCMNDKCSMCRNKEMEKQIPKHQ